MNAYLPDYKVRTNWNARNSLPVNRFPHSTVISERRGSRDEREKRAYYRQKEKEDDKNGNDHRRLSTGEKIDLDFLRTIANRSSQTSPSNVQIVTVEERYGAQLSSTNTEVIEKVPFQENDGMRCEESKENEEGTIAEKTDVGKEHVANNPVESYADVTPKENENASSTYEHSPMVDDNTEDGDHRNVERLSDTDTQNVKKRFKQENDDNSVKSDGNQKFSEISVSFDEEQSKISNIVEEVLKKQEGGEILEKHEGEEEVEDYNRELQRLGNKEDEQVLTPDQDSQQNNEKQQQAEEKDDQIHVYEEQGHKDKERNRMNETIIETNMEKSSPSGQHKVKAGDEYTQGISSKNNNNIRNSEALGL